MNEGWRRTGRRFAVVCGGGEGGRQAAEKATCADVWLVVVRCLYQDLSLLCEEFCPTRDL